MNSQALTLRRASCSSVTGTLTSDEKITTLSQQACADTCVALVVLAALVAIIFFAWSKSRSVKFDTAYQAVLLDSGQVYYGKVEGLGTRFPVMTDVFYVEHPVDPQTKEVKNILVRRGKEWHAPDHMVINARHIVLVEPVSPNSPVAQLIAKVP